MYTRTCRILGPQLSSPSPSFFLLLPRPFLHLAREDCTTRCDGVLHSYAIIPGGLIGVFYSSSSSFLRFFVPLHFSNLLFHLSSPSPENITLLLYAWSSLTHTTHTPHPCSVSRPALPPSSLRAHILCRDDASSRYRAIPVDICPPCSASKQASKQALLCSDGLDGEIRD